MVLRSVIIPPYSTLAINPSRINTRAKNSRPCRVICGRLAPVNHPSRKYSAPNTLVSIWFKRLPTLSFNDFLLGYTNTNIISPKLSNKSARPRTPCDALGLMLLVLFNSFDNSHCIVVCVAFETIHTLLTSAILPIGMLGHQYIVERLIKMPRRLI